MEDSTAEKIRAEFEKKVDSFVEGDLDHAAELLSAFWEVANKDEDVNVTRNPGPAVSLSRFRQSDTMVLTICTPRSHRSQIRHTGHL